MMALRTFITIVLFQEITASANHDATAGFQVGDPVYCPASQSPGTGPVVEVTNVSKHSKMLEVTGTHPNGNNFVFSVPVHTPNPFTNQAMAVMGTTAREEPVVVRPTFQDGNHILETREGLQLIRISKNDWVFEMKKEEEKSCSERMVWVKATRIKGGDDELTFQMQRKNVRIYSGRMVDVCSILQSRCLIRREEQRERQGIEQQLHRDQLMQQMDVPIKEDKKNNHFGRAKKFTHFRSKSGQKLPDTEGKQDAKGHRLESPQSIPELTTFLQELDTPAYRAFKERSRERLMRLIPRRQRATKYRKKRQVIPNDSNDSSVS